MLNNDDLFLSDEPIVETPKFSKAPYADCENCPLRDKPCVPTYFGTDDTRLVVVGEAPGFYEAKAGYPFVGPSGKLLDHLLAGININRDETVLTNAVLCRPDDNATPSAAALKACSNRLQAELASKPNTQVLALGKTAHSALKSAFNNKSSDNTITRIRGVWQTTPSGREYLPTFHPAYVLRNPSAFQAITDDFYALTVDRSKDWLALEQTVVRASSNFPMMLALEHNQYFSYDVETTGLNAHKADLLCLAIAVDDEHAYIFDKASVISHRQSLKAYFKDNRPIAHNGKFDNNVLHRYGIDVTLADDTMLMHYALNELKGTHGLKQLASVYLGVPDYEAELVDKHFKSIERKHRDYSKIPTEDLYRYLAIDVCATLALHSLFSEMLNADS